MKPGDLWNAVLFSSGDSPVTVGIIVLAILVIALGYVVSRALSHLVSHILVARVVLEPGATDAIDTLTFDPWTTTASFI